MNDPDALPDRRGARSPFQGELKQQVRSVCDPTSGTSAADLISPKSVRASANVDVEITTDGIKGS